MWSTEVAASVAARAFFYPSLVWNIARNRLQETWHWWDEITENVVLGAIPFYSTLEEFKKLEVKAVVTLNEGFEVFITTEQYQESGIDHLHIPTVDFLYAPPTCDLHKGVDFIHGHASEGRKTYVHCKAGRGRSTTLVVCYLIKYLKMLPKDAYTFVWERRPQVCLAFGQWEAVCIFYIDCHPGEGLKIEDFPYPTLLPLAPGKQGSDGTEPDASSASQTGSVEGSRGPGDAEGHPQTGGSEVLAGDGAHLPSGTAKPLGTPEEAHAACGPGVGTSKEVGISAATSLNSCPQPDSCRAGEGSGPSLQISASSTQGADSDDLVLLSSLGSTATSGSSHLSLSNVATALSSCCIHPRPDRGKGGPSLEPSVFLNGTGLEPPQRAASPAIEIPRGRSPEPKPLGRTVTPTQSSKGSITLEPSGSLPGYIRIAPATLARISGGEAPSIRTNISATGFTTIEDWADVSRSQGDN